MGGGINKTIFPSHQARLLASAFASSTISDQCLKSGVLLQSLGLVTGFNIWFGFYCFHVV